MEFHELKAFVVTADLMSVTQAAEHLHIAQPAVSRKIMKLEKYLGVKLFERAHGRLYLTVAGRSFHHDATIILAMLSNVETSLHRLRAASVDYRQLL